MMIITGGECNGEFYTCMYDANNIQANVLKRKEDGTILYGFYGIKDDENEVHESATLWFTEDMDFVSATDGHEIRSCENCKNCSQLTISDECMCSVTHDIFKEYESYFVTDCKDFKN